MEASGYTAGGNRGTEKLNPQISLLQRLVGAQFVGCAVPDDPSLFDDVVAVGDFCQGS